jgi:hypothetical protein
VVVSFEQDLFIISGEGKIVGKDKFAYTFGEGDSCLRYLSLRAKKSDNSVGRVVIRFLDDLGAEVMAPIEAVTSVTPLWGCSSI